MVVWGKALKTAGVVVILAVFALAASFGCGGTREPGVEGDTYQIGITQIIEHTSLDAAREGFIDSLKAQGFVEGENVFFDIKNAQNDKSNAISIAQKFVNDRVDLIFAISTPSAQAVAQATDEIPVLITAVTDPVDAGLVDSMDKPGGNVTGTTDLNPVAMQLELVKKFVPDAKKVGVLYNAGESNSEVQVVIARQAAAQLGLELVEAAVATTADVSQAAASLEGRVDAIYVPTDNTVVAALQTVIKVAEDSRIPVITGEGDSVRNGGLATYGIDYYILGRQTGDMAVKVLRGEAKPGDMPVESQKKMQLYINKAAAAAMGVEIPADLLEQADEIFE